MSCRSSQSWRCQMTLGWDWLVGADVPTPPVSKNKEVRGFLILFTIYTATHTARLGKRNKS